MLLKIHYCCKSHWQHFCSALLELGTGPSVLQRRVSAGIVGGCAEGLAGVDSVVDPSEPALGLFPVTVGVDSLTHTVRN